MTRRRARSRDEVVADIHTSAGEIFALAMRLRLATDLGAGGEAEGSALAALDLEVTRLRAEIVLARTTPRGQTA